MTIAASPIADKPIGWIPAASGGGITGTLAATETGSDTAAFAGDVYITGTLSASETGADTASFAGDVFITGTLAASETGADTASFTGTSAVVTTGYLAATETSSDTAAFAGDVYVSGTLAATESGTDTAAFSGDVLIDGTLAATESGSDTAAFTGTAAAAISGTLAASEEGADTAAFTNVTTTAAGWYDDKPKRKKRFVAEVDGKLLVYGSAQAAAKALNNRKADPEAIEQSASPEKPTPDIEVDLPTVEAFAQRTGQAEDYKTALNNKHLEAILKMFSDMEDEDDVEMLLMSL